MDWDVDYDADDDALALVSASAYLCISVTAAELRSLSRIDGADWEARRSLQAGTTLGQPVHWCLGAQPGTAQVLVGPDDETWDLAVTVPLSLVHTAAAKADADKS